ncbi:MAG: CCA tRNA nucleotidyltransferase [Gemmatimonadales bacterium]
MIFPPVLQIPDPILHIARSLERAGFEAWCVGGSLRDRLLGHPQSDFDLATSATPEEVQRLFPRTVAVGVKYGTVGVLDRDRVLHEVTTFRRDVSTDGRHAVVQYGVSLDDDLARRDFTINAIAYHPLRHEWRDPFSGKQDLEARLIRAVGNPAHRFAEDYLRILRALRFSARFGFAIDPETWSAAQAAAPGLKRLSAERVRDEWFKGLQTAKSVLQFASLWRDAGAASVWIPELDQDEKHTSREPPVSVRDPVLLTALLTRTPSTVLRRLKASNAEIERASAIERGPEQPTESSPIAVRRWLSLIGPAAADLAALWKLRRGKEPAWSPVVEEIRERGDPLTRGDLAVSGTDVQALGASGPEVGRVLSALLDQVLEEPSRNQRELLLHQARKLLQ